MATPDIVTANYGDSTVSVLLGNGDGTLPCPPRPLPWGVCRMRWRWRTSTTMADPTSSPPTHGTTARCSVLLNLGQCAVPGPGRPSGIPSRDVPQLQDLTGDGIPDAVSLDQRTGQILFRQGTGDPSNPYAPLVVVNPGRPPPTSPWFRRQDCPRLPSSTPLTSRSSFTPGPVRPGNFKRSAPSPPAPNLSASPAPTWTATAWATSSSATTSTTRSPSPCSRSPGTFDTFTRSVGAGPSSIAFADLNGDGLLDIVVSDQVSGDVSILFNDASHSFTTQERYRAGRIRSTSTSDPTAPPSSPSCRRSASSPATSPATAAPTGHAQRQHPQLQPAACGRGRFPDRSAGGRHLPGRPRGGSGAGGRLPGQRPAGCRRSDHEPDGTSQILVFPNNGNGTFGEPIVSAAGEDATGFSFVPGTAGQPDYLVVGNDYGDFLTLQGDGAGHFVVDRNGLNGRLSPSSRKRTTRCWW